MKAIFDMADKRRREEKEAKRISLGGILDIHDDAHIERIQNEIE